jgi:hypothetical protein
LLGEGVCKCPAEGLPDTVLRALSGNPHAPRHT